MKGNCTTEEIRDFVRESIIKNVHTQQWRELYHLADGSSVGRKVEIHLVVTTMPEDFMGEEKFRSVRRETKCRE